MCKSSRGRRRQAKKRPHQSAITPLCPHLPPHSKALVVKQGGDDALQEGRKGDVNQAKLPAEPRRTWERGGGGGGCVGGGRGGDRVRVSTFVSVCVAGHPRARLCARAHARVCGRGVGRWGGADIAMHATAGMHCAEAVPQRSPPPKRMHEPRWRLIRFSKSSQAIDLTSGSRAPAPLPGPPPRHPWCGRRWRGCCRGPCGQAGAAGAAGCSASLHAPPRRPWCEAEAGRAQGRACAPAEAIPSAAPVGESRAEGCRAAAGSLLTSRCRATAARRRRAGAPGA